MCHEIRKYMAQLDSDDPLGGIGSEVEIDETLVGGSVSGKGSGYKGNKTCVVGMLERNGELIATTQRAQLQKAQALFQSHLSSNSASLADELIAERRLEATRP